MSFMRRSKFKHVFGTAKKRVDCYDNIRITKSSWDSTFCSVNPKFLAIITECAGGGSFLVLPLEKVGRVDMNAPAVTGHKAPVLDIQWNPYNDNIIASGSEDCTVKVWEIPEGGLTENLTEPLVDLVAHNKRVGLVLWHPTAENVLLSSGADNLIIIWDVENQTPLVEFNCFPDQVLSASFNFDGSRLATVCKDKISRIIDARNGSIITEGQCHEGAKPQQIVYLKDNKIFTTGFSKMSERQYALWSEDNLKEPMSREDVDTSNGVQFIYYDPDCNMVYLCGKGDSSIRYFEITDEAPYVHFLNQYLSSDPQRGSGWITKRGVDVNTNEVARCFKLHTKGLCEVISFTCPRKSELFQEDIYPDTVGDEAALTAKEWLDGKNANPIMVSMKENFTGPTGAGKPKPAKINKITKIQKSGPNTSTAEKTDSSHSDADMTKMIGDMKKLMDKVSSLTNLCESLSNRVVSLESRLSKQELGHDMKDADA